MQYEVMEGIEVKNINPQKGDTVLLINTGDIFEYVGYWKLKTRGTKRAKDRRSKERKVAAQLGLGI